MDLIERHMNGFFDYGIADEVHELKGETAQGAALGTIASYATRTIVLTGTLNGRYADELFNLPETGEDRNPAGLYFHTWRAASAYRGYNNDIQTYVNPFAAEDPGEPQVTSRIGEGFNLDGK